MKAKTLQIHWHEKQPVYSCSFEPRAPFRLATAGADSCVRTWKIALDSNGNPIVEYLSTLSRHSGGVNAVRWSPTNEQLASAGDDGSIIIWQQNQNAQAAPAFGGTAEPSNEAPWTAVKILLSPQACAIYDLTWSPCGSYIVSASDLDKAVRLYDVQTGKMIQNITSHALFVQGVAWDPKGQYLASESSDRSVRFYAFDDKKKAAPLSIINRSSRMEEEQKEEASASQEQAQKKQFNYLYHNESVITFFRRLTFSPDGLLAVAPCGITKEGESGEVQHVVYMYARNQIKKDPICAIGGMKQAATVIRFSPKLFKLKEGIDPYIKLPYRMVFAVGTRESVLLFDTQHKGHIAVLRNFHYDCVTDLDWSRDGQYLIVSSIDGFCSLAQFDEPIGDDYVPHESIDAVMAEKVNC